MALLETAARRVVGHPDPVVDDVEVTDAVHCMTRLRITVRAVTATKEQLQRLPGVKGVLFPAAGQIHVVLGPGKAAAVTAARPPQASAAGK